MSRRAALQMSADEFLEWDLEQPDCRHELEDGVPVAMTGAKAELKRADVTYEELARRLRERGLEETRDSVAAKLSVAHSPQRSCSLRWPR